MYSKFLFAGLAALFAAVWVGCDDENAHHETRPYPEVTAVQIYLGATNDTLYFLPGDPAAIWTSVTIIVTDQNERAMPGVKVHVSLADPNLGVLVWSDQYLEDTTNSVGRVNAVYLPNDSFAGAQVISACVEQVCDNAVIWTHSGPDICAINLTGCDTLFVHPTFTDSCEHCLTVVDCSGHGIPGLTPNVHVTGGRFNPFPVTDSTGRSCSWGTPTGVGYYCLSIEMGGFSDSTCVTVLPDTTN